MSDSDSLPIIYSQPQPQLQSQSQPQSQPIKRRRTARYYADRVRESCTARVTKVLCAIVLSILLVVGVVSFILWLSLRPHRPKFHVTEFKVPGLAQPSGFENALIAFNFTARNPNQNIRIYYYSMFGSVFFKNQRIGSTPLLHPFFQEPKTTTIVHGTLDAYTLTVNSNRWKEFINERRHGTVVFRLDITSIIRFKISTWFSKHHKMHVNCNIAVGPDGSIFPAWKNKRCPVYFN